MANDTPVVAHRGERILAFMIASAVGLSLICIIAVVVGTAAGVKDFGQGVWPVVVVLPAIGLLLGLVLIIALLVISSLRRGRETKDAHE